MTFQAVQAMSPEGWQWISQSSSRLWGWKSFPLRARSRGKGTSSIVYCCSPWFTLIHLAAFWSSAQIIFWHWILQNNSLSDMARRTIWWSFNWAHHFWAFSTCTVSGLHWAAQQSWQLMQCYGIMLRRDVCCMSWLSWGSGPRCTCEITSPHCIRWSWMAMAVQVG
jgi:hypothetical protein